MLDYPRLWSNRVAISSLIDHLRRLPRSLLHYLKDGLGIHIFGSFVLFVEKGLCGNLLRKYSADLADGVVFRVRHICSQCTIDVGQGMSSYRGRIQAQVSIGIRSVSFSRREFSMKFDSPKTTLRAQCLLRSRRIGFWRNC